MKKRVGKAFGEGKKTLVRCAISKILRGICSRAEKCKALERMRADLVPPFAIWMVRQVQYRGRGGRAALRIKAGDCTDKAV